MFMAGSFLVGQLSSAVKKIIHTSTPLHAHAFSGDTNEVSSLLRNGADPNSKGDDKNRPLHFAVLGNGASMTAKNDDGQTPLYLAVAISANLDMVQFLLEMGADRNIKDNDGCTALDLAKFMKKEEVVRLLESTAQSNSETKVVHTNGPLHTAAESGDTDRVRSLLSSGTDPNIKGTNDLTPLHCAAYAGFIDTARLLIEHGASLSAKSERGGTTPLYFAVSNGKTEMVKFLLEKGAERSAKDKNGQTALDIARSKGYDEVVRLLEPAAQTNRAPAFNPTVPVSSPALSPACSPTPSAGSSAAAPKSLTDFLGENELQDAKDELTKHGFKTVRALKRTAEGQGDQNSFTAHMRSEGVKLSGGDFAELYAALMDI